MIVAWLAAITAVGGALCLYIATPHQALLARLPNTRLWRPAGAVLLLSALGLLLTLQGPATAVFTWATGTMLVWSIVPVAVRWWRFRTEAGK